MTQENFRERNPRGFEAGLKERNIIFFVIPHLKKVIAADKRISNSSQNLVTTFNFNQLVTQKVADKYWYETLKEKELSNESVEELTLAAIDFINSTRGKVYGEGKFSAFQGSLLTLTNNPEWSVIRNHLDRFIDVLELDRQVEAVRKEELEFYNKSLILGLRCAGVGTIWSREV